MELKRPGYWSHDPRVRLLGYGSALGIAGFLNGVRPPILARLRRDGSDTSKLCKAEPNPTYISSLCAVTSPHPLRSIADQGFGAAGVGNAGPVHS